jgi:protein-tyrosine phosphatase
VIDLHAHILPGLDDGPPNLDASAEMAAAAVANGLEVMAATSHVNRGFGLHAADMEAARSEVVERLEADGIPLEVVQGGEVSLSRLPDLDEEELPRLTLGGGRWLLLECPLSPGAPIMDEAVASLRTRGYEVLLAHPERSPGFMRGPDTLERLLGMGALAQVTSGSFSGEFGDTVRRAAFAMLERGLVHIISSDAHSAGHRPPDLRRALAAFEKRYDDAEEQFEWMAVAAPRALLAGDAPPPRPELPRARRGGLLRRLRSDG